jgi:hypothetical protein
MDIADHLVKEAKYQAERMQTGRPALEQELIELEKRKADIKAELKAIRYAAVRTRSYRPMFRQDFQCPRCWIRKETISILRAIPGNTKDDVLRCNGCGANILIPIGRERGQ